jgi:hypothetical protein
MRTARPCRTARGPRRVYFDMAGIGSFPFRSRMVNMRCEVC